jgi:NAD(P)-dependent dehydrogenase (short-subunit alcohol dehydrogenase family)
LPAATLITGASRGLGRAIALRLAREGRSLILHFRENRAAAEETAGEVARLGGTATVVQADLAVPAEIASLPARIGEGAVEALINNAGIWKATPLGSTSVEDADLVLGINLRAVFLLTQALLPRLCDGGRIVNVSSTAARTGIAGGRSLYGAAKAGVEALTRNWALELAPRGILVNAVAPGYVLTDMTAAHLADAEVRARALARHPLGRLGDAEEIAEVVAFLCSPAARGITGQSINASAGFVI